MKYNGYSIEINPQNLKAIAIHHNNTSPTTTSKMPDIKEAEKNTVLLIRHLFRKKGKWSEVNSYNLHRFLFLFIQLNKIWNTETNISIDFNSTNAKEMTGGGCYIPNLNTIQLTFPSVMTALHEFKHKLQHVYPNYKPLSSISIDKIIEPDAIMWSHAIFKLAFPKLYERNIANKKFFQIPNVLFPLKIFDKPTLKAINDVLNTEGIKIYSQENSLLVNIKPPNPNVKPTRVRVSLNKKQ